MNQAPSIFNRNRLALYRNRSVRNFHHHDFLLQDVIDNVMERLMESSRNFPYALELGCRTGQLATHLSSSGKVGKLVQTEISGQMIRQASGIRVQADEEHLPFAPSIFDLIVSVLNLHSVNDLPGTLIQARKALRPDGIFIASFFGGETLTELRQVLMAAEIESGQGVAPHVFPFADIKDAGMLMQRAGFTMPVADSYTLTASYQNLLNLMRELRGMGETNSLHHVQPYSLTRKTLACAEQKYKEMFPLEDGRIKATFEIITLTGMGS